MPLSAGFRDIASRPAINLRDLDALRGALAVYVIRKSLVRPAVLRGAAAIVVTQDMEQFISFEEVFVERACELERVQCTPSLVIDYESHVGYSSALARATYPAAPLIAFEPNPWNLAWLRRNLAPLGERASIHAAAVPTPVGTSRFVSEWSNTDRMDASSAAGLEVPVTRHV